MSPPTVVIGGGIVGASTASFLVRAGEQVVLLDRGMPGEDTSSGNAGGIQNLATIPISLPGMARKLPRWLSDPAGPLRVRPLYLPRALPWLFRFWREADVERVRRNASALSLLNRHSVECFCDLAAWAGAKDLLRVPGQMYLFSRKADYDTGTLQQELRAETGQPFEVLDRAAIRELEPGLSDSFELALRPLGNGHCRNPGRFMNLLTQRLASAGARVERRNAVGFETEGDRVVAVKTDGGRIEAGRIVIAAGVWSKPLAASLGHRVPLESQRGYQVTFTDPGVQLGNMLILVSEHIAITPMEMGIRVAGTVEFAGLSAAPDPRRTAPLVAMCRRFLPGLRTESRSEWAGHRPCTPDSVPVIGKSPRWRNVYMGFGHGHMGFIGGPPTGRLLAQLIAGRTPAADLSPYRVDRFETFMGTA